MISGFDMTEGELWDHLGSRPQYVYKIQRDDEVVYIGSTMRPDERMDSHECRVDGFSFYCAEVPGWLNASEVEKAAIATYTPPLNIGIYECDKDLVNCFDGLEFEKLKQYKSTGKKAKKYLM